MGLRRQAPVTRRAAAYVVDQREDKRRDQLNGRRPRQEFANLYNPTKLVEGVSASRVYVLRCL